MSTPFDVSVDNWYAQFLGIAGGVSTAVHAMPPEAILGAAPGMYLHRWRLFLDVIVDPSGNPHLASQPAPPPCIACKGKGKISQAAKYPCVYCGGSGHQKAQTNGGQP